MKTGLDILKEVKEENHYSEIGNFIKKWFPKFSKELNNRDSFEKRNKTFFEYSGGDVKNNSFNLLNHFTISPPEIKNKNFLEELGIETIIK